MAFFDFIKRKQSLLQSGVLQGMTDRHCHILFGVDDGIQTLEDSLAVLAYDEEVGIRDVWCTPHIMEDVPNATEALRERFAQLQQAYTGPVRLHLAAEYMLDTLFEERFAAGDLLTMENDNSNFFIEIENWQKIRSGEFKYDMKRVLHKNKKKNKGGNSLADEINRKMSGYSK